MNWWYYFKKSFSLYPGWMEAVSAPFLQSYYVQRRRERSVFRALLDGLIYLLFKLWVPFRAGSVARKFGFDKDWARRAGGIGRRRMADPNDIAVFRIAEDRDLDRYMRRFEYAEISKRINPAAWKDGCVLADKVGFARRCAENGLPAPRLLAHVTSKRIDIAHEPDGDMLAVKPTAGISGAGFALVPYPPGRRGRDDFEAFLRSWAGSRRGDWIVQGKVEGHPALKDLSLDALSTARITTMIDEEGDPEIVTSVLRFAGKTGAVVDNLAAGGLLAPIDPETGTLGAACYGRKPEDVASHPVTDAPIAGRVLPDWPEARALVLGAHRSAFREYSMIGWDVGVGEHGPVLIEGNGKPGLFAAQRAERQGVGETRFGALIAHHLEAAIARSAR